MATERDLEKARNRFEFYADAYDELFSELYHKNQIWDSEYYEDWYEHIQENTAMQLTGVELFSEKLHIINNATRRMKNLYNTLSHADLFKIIPYTEVHNFSRYYFGDISVRIYLPLIENPDAHYPTYDEVIAFYNADNTKDHAYIKRGNPDAYVCEEFANDFHNNAEAAGLKCAVVSVKYSCDKNGHAVNAFHTTDKGIIYVDTCQKMIYSADAFVGKVVDDELCVFNTSNAPHYFGLGNITYLSLLW